MNTQRDNENANSESYGENTGNWMKCLAFGAFRTDVISYRKVASGKKYTLIHILIIIMSSLIWVLLESVWH